MAEDKDGASTEVAENEGATAESESSATETSQEQQAESPADPVAALASELGWVPKEKFRGDESEWKPADEFIRASRDINRSLSRELKSVREEVGRMGRVSSQLLADKIAERDAYWSGIHRQAVEEGNVDLAERAVTERVKLRDATPPDGGPPPETRDFIERNKDWYGKDQLATMRAQEICGALAQRGIAEPEQLRQAERAIRKEFPELFPAPAKQPAGVQTAQARNASASGREKKYADMPAESQKMAREYQERHGIPVETFAKSYWQDQERKVG